MKGVSRRSELMLCFDWPFCSKTFAKQTNQQKKKMKAGLFLIAIVLSVDCKNSDKGSLILYRFPSAVKHIRF